MKSNFSAQALLLATAGWSLLAGLMLVAPDRARAQLLQGTLDGNVMDSTQAAVAGASAAVTNQETNARRETLTNSVGGYSLPTLPPGTYTLTVSAAGFQTYTQTGIAVTINNVTRVDVILRVGQLTETVTVEAQAATLQTDRADVRAEVTQKTLKDIPVPIGRNYQMLFLTLPGVSPPENAHSFASNPVRAVRFSVNGATRSNNNTRIDGTSSTNITIPHMVAYVPALESIETVNVVTNSFDAEQGLAGGAAINMQIKTGSNAIHGSLFEYHNDQHIKAYEWSGDRTQPKPKYIYNQFGGTIGGAIKKDKLFYFVSFEGTRGSELSSQVVSVPTAVMKSGDLSRSPTAIYDPLTGNPDGSNRLPFEGNIIPRSRIDAGVQKIIDTGDWPNPNQVGTGTFGLNRDYLAAGSTTSLRNMVDSKLNWNPSNKLSTFVRLSVLDHAFTNDQVFGRLGGRPLHRTNSAVGEGHGKSFSGTISATYVATPNFVFDAYYGYTRLDVTLEQQRISENLGFDFLGVPGLKSSLRREGGWPQLAIDGFDLLGAANTFQPEYYRDPQYQYVGNANWTKGTHNVRFGTDFYIQHLNQGQPQGQASVPGASGGFRFSQGTTQLRGGPNGNDLNAFASFLLGLPQEAGKVYEFPDEYHTRTRMFSTYIRDRWQVTPKLTMSYGVRWEYFPIPTRGDRGVERYDFDNNKVLVCGVGSIPMDCGITKGKQRFVPRLGLAYRATDSFVIRAGYGLSNDPFNYAIPLRLNFPNIFTQDLTASNSLSYATTLRQGLPPVSAPDLSKGVLDIDPNAVAVTLDNNNLTRGYIQSWNFTLEKRLGGWIGSAGYIATRSVNQLNALEQNWSPIGGGNAGRILNQKFGRVASTQLLGNLGTAKYDSLQMRAERRFANGLQIGTSYTFGKSLGYSAEDSGALPARVAIPYLYRLNYGRLTQDIRHNLQVTWIAELPFGKGKRWAASGMPAQILGGWQINGLLSAYSGTPFTVTASNASLNAAGSSQFADCVGQPVMLGNITQWYDKSAFTPVQQARFGTCGNNNLSGPGMINMDLSMDRRFKITERIELKLRAEMFNVANTPHHSNPDGNVNSGSFMQALGIRNTGREGIDERTFRLGLRLGW